MNRNQMKNLVLDYIRTHHSYAMYCVKLKYFGEGMGDYEIAYITNTSLREVKAAVEEGIEELRTNLGDKAA